jgi:predicted MFS family arabinose efflux permease
MQSIAQPWLVLQLTHSAFLVGLVLAVQNLPILVAGPFGGLVADRYAKRRVLQVTQAAFMVPALFLFAVTMTGTVQNHRDQISVIGVPLCFLVNGLSYVAVITALTLMRNLPSLVHEPDRQPLFQRMREGARYLRRDPLVGGMLLVVAVFSLFAMNRLTLIPLFADGVLKSGAAGFGLLMAALGLGALTGGLSLALVPQSASGRRQFWVGLLWAASIFGFAFSRSMPLSLALLFVAGVGQMWFLATANTRIQMATPDRLRGRVMAFYAQAMMGVGPLGAMQAGVLASILGAPAAMWVGAGACALIIIAVRIGFRAVFTLEPDQYDQPEGKF